MNPFLNARLAASAGFLRPGGSVAVAARTTATASATTTFAVTTAATGTATAATTASTTTTTTLALTTATEAATTAAGLTSDLVETVVGGAVGLSSLLARCLGVPGLACSVAGGGIVGPAAGGLWLRRLDRRSSRGVDLLVGPGNDLVVVLNVLLLSAGG